MNSNTEKTTAQARDTELSNAEVSNIVEQYGGTTEDEKDMYRLGKQQSMRRNFRLVTIFGFSMVLMSTWETALGTSFFALFNGGTAGFIWTYLVSWVGFLCINTSMAEMASQMPTSGGQYHWVSEIAPYNHQKFLSFLIGWFCVLGWQTGSPNTALLSAQQIQGLLVLNYETYVYERWHTTLIALAVATFSTVIIAFFNRKLPMLEGVVLFIHIAGFFAIFITLWVLGPKGGASQVFTTFNNYGGWSDIGGSALVGMFAVILPLLGADAAVHMSEELKDASRQLPRAMIATTVVNGSMGFLMIVALCMMLGNLDAVINTPTFEPFIEVFFEATQSYKGTNALTAIVIFMQIFCNLSITATASRQIFAFARDQGIPFGAWFAYVKPGWDIPINSIIVTWLVSCLLCLINIGSNAAFNSIASLSVSGTVSSYIVSIGCMALKRIRNERMLPSKFSLGRWTGLALNLASLAFLVLFLVLSFFPPSPHPNAAGMNWSVLIFGVVIIGALLHYYVSARKHYDGPVEYTRKTQ